LASEAEKIETYRHRAGELRTIAERMKHEESRKLLLQIADDYERMAKALQKHATTPR
jgi:ferritin-like metal-binding protein YciE